MITSYIQDRAIRDNQYIVFSRIYKRKKALSRVQAYKTIKKVSNDLKIDFIGTHTLRKIFAVNHYRKNKDIRELQKTLNHKDLSTTLLYVLGGIEVN